MSACNTFTEHVWKPGECKNCFKPKSLHRLPEGVPHRFPPEQVLNQHSHTSTGGTSNINHPSLSPTEGRAIVNSNLASNPQRSSSSSRSGQFRPPVAKKPTIAVKPTMMLPCSGLGLDLEGNPQNLVECVEPGKASAFTVWNHNGLNPKRPPEPNNNERNDERGEMDGFTSLCPPSSNNNNGLTDVLKEIAGLGSDLSSSRDDFLGRISCSYRRSLERGLPASSCLALGRSSSANKHVSLSDSAEIISSEGGRFCYPEFSSDGEEDEEYEEESESDDGEHESWDESDEELLAMEIRMRGQPRFANFRAATLSPVRFAAGKKWNTVPLRNRSLQRICAVDYDSYDDILNGYPSMDSSGARSLLPYDSDPQGSGFLSISESITSPESSSSLPEDSCTSSSGSSVPCNPSNGLHPFPLNRDSAGQEDTAGRALSSPKATETHKAVLAIRLQDQDINQREGGPLPQALPGQPITISFSPTEEQPKPYRVVSLEKTPICKPYTVVDVSASMASTEDRTTESTAKPKGPTTALSPPPYPGASKNIPLSAKSPISPKTPLSPKSAAISPTTPVSPFTSVSPSIPVSLSTALANVTTSSPSCKKPGSSRYQEVWTSSTSPRQKLPKVELLSGTPAGSSVTPRHANHKSAPTSPVAGISSSRTIPVKSPNLSEIKFNSYNNAGMPPFPIIIRDEPTYARSSKNAVKVPIVINPSAYDNLAVYKSFLGVSGDLPQPKPGTGGRVPSHTYEEIGNSETAHSSPTEHKPTRKFVSADAKEERDLTRTVPHNDKTKNIPECNTAGNISVTVSSPRTNTVPTNSTASSSLIKSSTVKLASSFNPSDDSPVACSSECQTSTSTGSGHREKASMVLSQIVASIPPPQSPPDSPSSHSKTYSAEELYSLPPDATKGTLSRPKSLHTESSLSKSHKDTPSKLLPKSQSASAAEGPTSPKSEPSAPFPPPRSTSSPYHASNILQRHFSNWSRPMGSRPSDGEVSPGAEGRRSADSNRPKRWISFKSFFRRRKDEDEQKEKVEREKEKGKLVGLDGTVITMLPPPPLQRQHWFSESKTDDPNQKPTIIFTYKPDSGSGGDGEAELRVEECNAGAGGVSFNQSGPPKSRASLLISKVMSQMPVQGPEMDTPAITSLPAKVELLTMREQANLATRPMTRPLSPTVSLGEPEEDEGTQTHSHSHSPASSYCSATYTNLGQSRASLIPTKHPRHLKTSDDGVHSESEGFSLGAKVTPPPLPKKSVPRANTEPSLTIEPMSRRPRGEVKPGGASLSVANPLYDLDSTWDTASQSSSLSSDARHLDESGDSLERPVGGGRSISRSGNSSTAPDRERRGCRSTESLTASKTRRLALYRGLESWEEVASRIRNLHADTLRKLAGRCEDRFMAGQKDLLRFGTDSWSHFRLTTGKPCCEAEDAVYYTAAYSKDPLINYAVKICRYKVKETQQQFFHSLAVRQSLSVHYNIQQDCGHFLADVPARLLPWENEDVSDDGRGEKRQKEHNLEQCEVKRQEEKGHGNIAVPGDMVCHGGSLRSRVVVITREVPFQTVADFVQEGSARHSRNPELYERQVCLLLLQLCSGLEHMKPYHVSHCDLHLKNLLLVHCHPGDPWNLELPESNNNSTSASSACPARLIISNFSQAKQQSVVRYTECDEFQLGLLIYEMLHQPNPLADAAGLKEREQLPPLPTRSLYSQGLMRLAGLLLHTDESERIGVAEARACLQCLLWGPRDDLLRAAPLPIQRHAALQNWLDLKRTLMMIKFAERSLDAGHSGAGVSLEDWLCCKYLAFATTDSIDRVVRVLQQI
ncbi:inactive tyrosine-protein kinase PEAK1 [Tachysurus vachellii]|uniref:inactive tyrosine-protein kinase PEAK1 n=1 Tax=Tachysurus vachellii TaxID=175792 RepID=UPI00296B429C|nr:inactive tyrosine-protein kinase PEAK1 [Tachysurus vachellii]XP_060742221.1 inactive tyrosine-protein kinase PEAK1 [Tachysurus vachellii]